MTLARIALAGTASAALQMAAARADAARPTKRTSGLR